MLDHAYVWAYKWVSLHRTPPTLTYYNNSVHRSSLPKDPIMAGDSRERARGTVILLLVIYRAFGTALFWRWLADFSSCDIAKNRLNF